MDPIKLESHLSNTLNRLRRVTRDCRTDMHEPDEQGVTAKFGPATYKSYDGKPRPVVLDNAFTGPGFPDMGVWISRDGKDEWFNLADLIALARMAE